ncbi:MAG TPA: hypothetical protein VMW52_11910 [Phycisphaerae bacterium]|nr:hypothetical protein [Phycisphaerae bacterium]
MDLDWCQFVARHCAARGVAYTLVVVRMARTESYQLARAAFYSRAGDAEIRELLNAALMECGGNDAALAHRDGR